MGYPKKGYSFGVLFKVVSRFFFETGGAKKKLTKRNAKKSFALCGARGGLRALHCAAF